MEQFCNPGFDVTVHAFDTSTAVRLRSSPYLTPDRIFVLPFPMTLTTLTLNQRSSQRFGNYFWKSSPEGSPPSLFSYEQYLLALVAHQNLHRQDRRWEPLINGCIALIRRSHLVEKPGLIECYRVTSPICMWYDSISILNEVNRDSIPRSNYLESLFY